MVAKRINTHCLWAVGVFVLLFLEACSQHPEALAVQPSAPVSDSLSAEVRSLDSLIHQHLHLGTDRPSWAQLKSGLQSIEQKEWLEAQYYLDLALAELISERDQITPTAQDSVYFKEIFQHILFALERVYPHLEDLGEPDSGFTFWAPIGVDEEEDVELDADTVVQDSLKLFLDTLSLLKFSLPVELNERVVRELNYLAYKVPTFTAGALSRKSLYQEMIASKLQVHQMPEDLIYLSMVESGYKAKAYSHASASGLWQFIRATARRYGIQVDYWVDMRRNPELSTDAALSYLQDLYSEFGDWLLAMAAYNCGEGRIRRLLREKDSLTYWDLRLPKETMHYVPRILAATIIGHYPEKFGFAPEELNAIPYDTVTVKDCVPLQMVAEATGSNLRTIRDLNFELQKWCTPPNKRVYTLKLPAGTGDLFRTAYAKMDKKKFARWHRHRIRNGENLGVIARSYGLSVRALKDANGLQSSFIRAGQMLLIPLPSGALPPSGSEAQANKESFSRQSGLSHGRYRVKRGDNLGKIARRYGISIHSLTQWNQLQGDVLKIGQVLWVRTPDATPSSQNEKSSSKYQVRSGDTYYSIARSHQMDVKDLMALNGAQNSGLKVGQWLYVSAPSKLSSKENAVWHTVSSGENLYSISRKYDVSVDDLLLWNQLERRHILKIGQRLRVVMASNSKKQLSTGRFYRVQVGDTLWDIARRYGVGVQELKKWNNMTDGKLQPGRKLKVGL